MKCPLRDSCVKTWSKSTCHNCANFADDKFVVKAMINAIQGGFFIAILEKRRNVIFRQGVLDIA
jgi:hypothetical protein